MELFYKPGACSLATHIVLYESGQDFTLNKVDLVKKRLENGEDFFKINPKGQVPALLLDDGTLLTEGAVIMQYLADNSKTNNSELLAPFGSILRYKTLEWLNYISTELHKIFSLLFRLNIPERYKSALHKLLEDKVRFVNEQLNNSFWICGSNFTIADAYLFTVLHCIKKSAIISELVHTTSYINQVMKRKTVCLALKEEGLI